MKHLRKVNSMQRKKNGATRSSSNREISNSNKIRTVKTCLRCSNHTEDNGTGGNEMQKIKTEQQLG